MSKSTNRIFFKNNNFKVLGFQKTLFFYLRPSVRQYGLNLKKNNKALK